jgi:hypothetical protein
LLPPNVTLCDNALYTAPSRRRCGVCPLQAARSSSSSKPQPRQLAFRAPARALYFHSRQSIVAAAAEVRCWRVWRGGRVPGRTACVEHCALIAAALLAPIHRTDRGG